MERRLQRASLSVVRSRVPPRVPPRAPTRWPARRAGSERAVARPRSRQPQHSSQDPRAALERNASAASFRRRLLGHDAATAATRCRSLAFLQNERGRDAFRFDARRGILRLTRLDRDLADVDDPRELADPIEEQTKVVVRALGAQLERQRGVHRLLLWFLRREALNRQARLRGQSLNTAQDVGDVFLLRENRAQILEPPLELGNV